MYSKIQVSNPGRSKQYFLPPRRPEWLLELPSLLFIGVVGSLSWGVGYRGVNFTTHNHLVPRLKMVEIHVYSPHVLS
jgi:hypothetical protein